MTTQAGTRYQSIYTSWWFGNVVLIGICGGALLLSALMTPGDEVLSLFGYEVPMMCGYRRTFGMPCIGCGLTRSFTYLAHLQVAKAFELNLLGPPLFVLMATQPPYRLWQLWKGLRARR